MLTVNKKQRGSTGVIDISTNFMPSIEKTGVGALGLDCGSVGRFAR